MHWFSAKNLIFKTDKQCRSEKHMIGCLMLKLKVSHKPKVRLGSRSNLWVRFENYIFPICTLQHQIPLLVARCKPHFIWVMSVRRYWKKNVIFKQEVLIQLRKEPKRTLNDKYQIILSYHLSYNKKLDKSVWICYNLLHNIFYRGEILYGKTH